MWLGMSVPTHIGSHSLSIDSLHIPADAAQAWRSAGARRAGRDSLLVVLNPAPDHGAVVLQGVIRDTLVTGHWSITGYVRGASGRFVMQRRSYDLRAL